MLSINILKVVQMGKCNRYKQPPDTRRNNTYIPFVDWFWLRLWITNDILSELPLYIAQVLFPFSIFILYFSQNRQIKRLYIDCQVVILNSEYSILTILNLLRLE